MARLNGQEADFGQFLSVVLLCVCSFALPCHCFCLIRRAKIAIYSFLTCGIGSVQTLVSLRRRQTATRRESTARNGAGTGIVEENGCMESKATVARNWDVQNGAGGKLARATGAGRDGLHGCERGGLDEEDEEYRDGGSAVGECVACAGGGGRRGTEREACVEITAENDAGEGGGAFCGSD